MDDNGYVLEYCDVCVQMTNHLDGVCMKCKNDIHGSIDDDDKREDKITQFLEKPTHAFNM